MQTEGDCGIPRSPSVHICRCAQEPLQRCQCAEGRPPCLARRRAISVDAAAWHTCRAAIHGIKQKKKPLRRGACYSQNAQHRECERLLALVASLTQQFAVLLLAHPLAALLDDRTHLSLRSCGSRCQLAQVYYQTRTHETNRQNFLKYFSPRAHRAFQRGTIHKHRQPPLTHSKDSARKQPQTPENAPADHQCDSHHSHIAAPAQPRQSKTQQPQRPSHTTTTPDRQCDSNHSHIAKIRHGNTSKCPKNTPSGTQCASRHSHITAATTPATRRTPKTSHSPTHLHRPDRQCDSQRSHITRNPARKQPQTPENAPSSTQCVSHHSHITGIQHGKSPKPLKTPRQTAYVTAVTHT